MENPIKAVTSNLTVGNAIKFAVGGLIVFALLDLMGVTNWLLFPVSTAKSKFARTA